MTDIKSVIEGYLAESATIDKATVHPRPSRAVHPDQIGPVYTRGEGAYLFDAEGNKTLDFSAGGGVHFIGRNHPTVTQACRDLLEMDLPNLSIVNASILGGLVAGRLLDLTNGHMGKVIYANSGTEATDVMVRFARFVTRKRRFLYLEGAFHGRSFGAISLTGLDPLKDGMEPFMPTTTAIPPNDLRRLRQELKQGDVAGFIFEPIQRLTGTVLDRGYLREAEVLCKQADALMLADESQTGLGRTGHWFRTTGTGIRPDMLSTSGALSGGAVPVSAVMMTNEVYDRVYTKLTSGPIYFSTFAENNLAMTAALTTLDVLAEADAPALAQAMSEALRARLDALREKHPAIERVGGDGLMLTLHLGEGVAAAEVAATMLREDRVLVQVPLPGAEVIGALPPIVTTEEDLDWFVDALDRAIEAQVGAPMEDALARELLRATPVEA